jgi:hypothetical protein
VPFSDQISYLLKRAIPDALDPIVRRAVGGTMPRLGEDDRYRITYTGAFSSRVAADLLTFGRNQRLDGALILIDEDVLRAVYYRAGTVVGAESNVLFERLGRVLERAGQTDASTAEELVRLEESGGVAAATQALPPETARFALERRAWEIAAALFLIHRGHFLIVEGAPDLGAVEALELNAMDLALEGLRRYDEWRNGDSGAPLPNRPSPTSRPPDAALAAFGDAMPVRRGKSNVDPVEEFLRQLRAAP